MTNTLASELTVALHDKLLVRFSRLFELGSVKGYILDIGPDFFLVACVSDSIWFDGFQSFRMSDVRDLQVPDEYASFVEAALGKRGERVPAKPPVSVASIEELLLSAGRAFPLVTIYREEVDPDVCGIGRVISVRDGWLSLLEINPDASWDQEPSEYPVNEITRVDFGGDYEEALQLVGGRDSVIG